MPQGWTNPNLTPQDFGIEPAMGALRGLRGFKIEYMGPLSLRGHQGVPWKVGENVAYCLKGHGAQPWPGKTLTHDETHPVPVMECSCGIYAWWPTVPPYMENYSDALAATEGYGSVLVGSKGFRAEKAQLLGITGHGDDPPMQEDLDELAGLYGVPLFPDLDAMLAEFPLTYAPVDQPTS